MCHNPYSKETILMELKSTKQKSLPLNNIKNNQLVGLCNASTYEGVKAYFIINFRTTEETFAIEAKKVKEFIKETERKSIPIDWCRKNGILIEQEKKRSRYKYNIDSFLVN